MRFLIFFAVCFLFLSPAAGYCGDDLDDGIPIDDSISNYDELKRPLNKSYIKRRAKSMADISAADGCSFEYDDYVVGIGNIFAPGAEFDDIVIIIEGLDDVAIVGEKK